MTEQMIERCLERLAICKTTDVMNFDYAGTLAYIYRLKAENATLCERLEKAVELPVKIGDRVFCIVGLSPAVEEFEVEEIVIQRTNPTFAIFRFIGIDTGIKTAGFLSEYGKRWFTELEAAEARLAELKGEKK